MAAARRLALVSSLSLAVCATPVLAQVVELAKLAARDGTPASRFGSALAIEGDRIVVGAPGDTHASDAGAVYVFEHRPHIGWSEVAKLTASDPQPEGRFGRSVAMSGDRLLIGAGASFGDPLLGNAYVFERLANGAWIQVAALEPSDAAQGLGQGFGGDVALDGNRALVGAAWNKPYVVGGAGYLFERQASGAWLEVAKLQPPSVYVVGLAGSSVALDGDRALLGAPWDDYGFDAKGCLYFGSVAVFERDRLGNWVETVEIHPDDATCGAVFGGGISLEKDRLLVGCTQDDTLGVNAGAAYIFERNALGSWQQVAKLLAPDGSEDDFFGGGALNRDWALVRSSKSNESQEPGKAYLFHRQLDGQWLSAAEIGSSAGTAAEDFGGVVALRNGLAVVGAPSGDGAVPGSGVAYVFDVGR